MKRWVSFIVIFLVVMAPLSFSNISSVDAAKNRKKKRSLVKAASIDVANVNNAFDVFFLRKDIEEAHTGGEPNPVVRGFVVGNGDNKREAIQNLKRTFLADPNFPAFSIITTKLDTNCVITEEETCEKWAATTTHRLNLRKRISKFNVPLALFEGANGTYNFEFVNSAGGKVPDSKKQANVTIGENQPIVLANQEPLPSTIVPSFLTADEYSELLDALNQSHFGKVFAKKKNLIYAASKNANGTVDRGYVANTADIFSFQRGRISLENQVAAVAEVDEAQIQEIVENIAGDIIVQGQGGQGVQGPAGPQGPQGPAGGQGAPGVAGQNGLNLNPRGAFAPLDAAALAAGAPIAFNPLDLVANDSSSFVAIAPVPPGQPAPTLANINNAPVNAFWMLNAAGGQVVAFATSEVINLPNNANPVSGTIPLNSINGLGLQADGFVVNASTVFNSPVTVDTTGCVMQTVEVGGNVTNVGAGQGIDVATAIPVAGQDFALFVNQANCFVNGVNGEPFGPGSATPKALNVEYKEQL